METIINGNEYHQWHESFEAMEDWCRKAMPRNSGNVRAYTTQVVNVTRGYSWFGAADARAVLDNIGQGWPENAELVRKAANELDAGLALGTVEAMTMEVRKRKRRRMDYGDTLDMQRVWGGELDRAWERPVRHPKLAPTQRYATVFVDTSTPARMGASQGMWRAACAVRICDLLTCAGLATEIWVGSSSEDTFASAEAHYSWVAVRAKEYTQPVNLDRIAALTSVGGHRTISFKMKCSAPYYIVSGFGRPYNSGLPINLRKRQEAGERVVRIGQCWYKADAIAEVAKIARELAPRETV